MVILVHKVSIIGKTIRKEKDIYKDRKTTKSKDKESKRNMKPDKQKYKNRYDKDFE